MSSRSMPVMNVLTSSLLICSEIFFSLRRARIRSSRFCVLRGDFINSMTSRTLSWDSWAAASSSSWKRSPLLKNCWMENMQAKFCKKNSVAHEKSILQRVPNVLRLAEINHFLSDIFGVIGDALQTFRGDNPMQAAPDGVGIFCHVLRKLLVNLLVKCVHILVARNDGAGGYRIPMDKRIERVL